MASSRKFDSSCTPPCHEPHTVANVLLIDTLHSCLRSLMQAFGGVCFPIDISWNTEPSFHRIAFAVDPSRERPSVFVHHTFSTSTGCVCTFHCSPVWRCNSYQLFVSKHPSAKSTDCLGGTVHDTLLATTIANVTLSAVDALVQISHDVDDVARLSTPVLVGSRCDVQRLWLVRLHPFLYVSVDARASNCAITSRTSLVAEPFLCVRHVETTFDDETFGLSPVGHAASTRARKTVGLCSPRKGRKEGDQKRQIQVELEPGSGGRHWRKNDWTSFNS